MEMFHHQDPEHLRIENLRSYEILDTSPEPCFDEMAYLAGIVCQTPIALISFIDSDRQWFKASYGIQLSELPRFLSPCNKTIIHDGVHEVPDFKTCESPFKKFMLGEQFEFYAGVSITSEEGHNIGTLCVIDFEPHDLTAEQRKTLKVISRQITSILSLRKEYKSNLVRMNDLSLSSYHSDRKIQEIINKTGLRSMAELSAGISFKIRPHIMAIQNIAKSLEGVVEESGVLYRSAEEVMIVMNGLKNFISAEKEKSMRVIDILDALEPTLSFLEHKLKAHNIEVKCDFEKDMMTVGNISQIKQVFFEIITNAIDAVKDMQIRVIEIIARKSDHAVLIFVKDSGKGVAPNVAPFIFQPLFSTKGHSSLGAGLSLAQSLIQRHSGEITLEKAYGPTTFKIFLPTP
jgi:signal transduction histidine kinase